MQHVVPSAVCNMQYTILLFLLSFSMACSSSRQWWQQQQKQWWFVVVAYHRCTPCWQDRSRAEKSIWNDERLVQVQDSMFSRDVNNRPLEQSTASTTATTTATTTTSTTTTQVMKCEKRSNIMFNGAARSFSESWMRGNWCMYTYLVLEYVKLYQVHVQYNGIAHSK